MCYSPPLLAGFRCLWWCAVPRHSWLGPAGGGGAWRVVCGVWCVVCGGGVLVGLWLWLVPRHSWRRFLCSTPRHSWLGFDAGGGGRSSPLLAEGPGRGSPPLLAGVRWRRRCVVGLWLVCGVVGPSPLLAEFPVCYSPPLLAGFRCRWWCAVSRHSWLGPAGGGGAWCVVCGVRRWCVGGVVGGVWCGWSLATPGGGSCVLLPATPGWVSLPVVVGGPRHSWLGSAGGGGVWCAAVVCWWLVPRHSWRRFLCATPRHSWLGFAAGGGGRSSPLLAGVRWRRCVAWSVPRHSWRRFLRATPRHSWLGFGAGGGVWSPASPGCGPLAAVVCGVWCVVCGVWCVVCGVWCAVVVCWWGCGWCVVWLVPRHSRRRFLCATPRHSWLGFAAGGGGRSSPLLAEGPGRGSPPLLAGFRCRRWCVVCGVWCVACGVRRWRVWWVCGWCGWSLATPGGGSCVLLPATPGWVSLPVVVWCGGAVGVSSGCPSPWPWCVCVRCVALRVGVGGVGGGGGSRSVWLSCVRVCVLAVCGWWGGVCHTLAGSRRRSSACFKRQKKRSCRCVAEMRGMCDA